MLAINEPEKPSDFTKKPDSKGSKQITTILKEVRNQHTKRYPQNKMPSDFLLEQLVINGAKKDLGDNQGWLERTKNTLQEIIVDMSYSDCQYINNLNSMPLFPTKEGFNNVSTYKAMILLLSDLESLKKL